MIFDELIAAVIQNTLDVITNTSESNYKIGESNRNTHDNRHFFVHCGATREASSNWGHIQFEKPESNRLWAEYRKETDTLLTQLIWIMRYAYRNSDDLLAQLSLFKVAGSNLEVIQALNDISVNGKKNLPFLLATPKFEESMFERVCAVFFIHFRMYMCIAILILFDFLFITKVPIPANRRE